MKIDKVRMNLSRGIREETKSHGKACDRHDKEYQWRSFDPDEDPPRHAVTRRSTAQLVSGSEFGMDVNETTYYIACFHVNPKRLFTAAAILKTREANQKQLTEMARFSSPSW